jgi:hypothetical protein
MIGFNKGDCALPADSHFEALAFTIAKAFS